MGRGVCSLREPPETLRERIDRERQLPLDEALGIATAALRRRCVLFACALSLGHGRLSGCEPREGSSALGVFEFVILLVLISTVGKVLSDRRPRRELKGSSPELGRGELEGIREAMDDLSERLGRLEEERDFYRNLLEAPERPREIRPPEVEEAGSDLEAT